jgi:hypothetical protein
MQVNTLTTDNIPGPNRELMQQAFTRLMVPSHAVPQKNNWILGRVPPGFAKLLRKPVLGCSSTMKIDLVNMKTGYLC